MQATEIYKIRDTKTRVISTKIVAQLISLFGHNCRMDDNCLNIVCLELWIGARKTFTYLAGPSTVEAQAEASLRVCLDMLMAADEQKITLLSLLDMGSYGKKPVDFLNGYFLFVCLLRNGISALFWLLVPRIVEIEDRHV